MVYNITVANTKTFPLVRIDGFNKDKRMVVAAATNRKENLDPALIRYGFSVIEVQVLDVSI